MRAFLVGACIRRLPGLMQGLMALRMQRCDPDKTPAVSCAIILVIDRGAAPRLNSTCGRHAMYLTAWLPCRLRELGCRLAHPIW